MVICHIGHLAVLVEAAFCQGFPKGFDSPRLVRFRGVHDALAWKDLMAEVDLTILSIAQAAPGAKGMGQGMVLTELVTQLHHLAESAQQQTERRQIQLESAESAAEAAQQQQFAAELRQEELETQNLRLEAELAKTQMIRSTLQDRGRKGLSQRKNTWESWDGGKCHWNVIDMSLKCHWWSARFQFMRCVSVNGWPQGFQTVGLAWWFAGGDGRHRPQRSKMIRDMQRHWMRHETHEITTGWWFVIFFIFPYVGNNHPNWLFFSGGLKPPTRWDYNLHSATVSGVLRYHQGGCSKWMGLSWVGKTLRADSYIKFRMLNDFELWTQYPEASMHHTTKQEAFEGIGSWIWQTIITFFFPGGGWQTIITFFFLWGGGGPYDYFFFIPFLSFPGSPLI